MAGPHPLLEQSALSDCSLLVTGRHFGGRGLRSIMPVMQELVAGARSEIHVLAYMMTGGARPIVNLLTNALERGVRVILVVNGPDDQVRGVVDELTGLSHVYTHMRVTHFTDPDGSQLHAKVLVADRARAVIGSANFSWGGLVSNHEVGALLGGRAAWELAAIVDELGDRRP